MNEEVDSQAQFEDDEQFIKLWHDPRVDMELPERYRRLCCEVLVKLPSGWDQAADWIVIVDLPEAGESDDYGSIRDEEETSDDGIRLYTVIKIYLDQMDRLSDAAWGWVIACKFAHVASRLLHGTITVRGKLYSQVPGAVDEYEETPATANVVHMDTADRIAMGWGFSAELAAFLAEVRASGP
jgi:hypothetical protein